MYCAACALRENFWDKRVPFGFSLRHQFFIGTKLVNKVTQRR